MVFRSDPVSLSGDGLGTGSRSAPDFGLTVRDQGCSPTARLDFPFFQIPELGVLGPGRYTVIMMMPLGRVAHALSLDFGPATLRGTVQLSGVVGTQAEIDKAAALARGITGVTSVKTDIRPK